MENQKPNMSLHLSEYYGVIRKQKWIILSSLVIMVLLTMFFTFRMKPLYRATATLVIDEERSKSPLNGEGIDFAASYASQAVTLKTHSTLITSRQIIETLIGRLKLNQGKTTPEVNSWDAFLSRIKKSIHRLLGHEEKPLTDDAQLTREIDSLRSRIDIQEVKNTRLLRISVQDSNPEMAFCIANSLAATYIEFNIANKLRSSKDTLNWMREQLNEMKSKLEGSEEAFLDYKQQENLFSIEGKQKLISQKIADFNDAQLQARNKRLEVEAKLHELKRSLRLGVGKLGIRSLIGNPVIDSLNTQLLNAEVELSRLSKVYKSKHPKIIQIKTKIEKTEKKLAQEINKEIKSLEAERAVLLAKEKAMERTIADFGQEALSTNRKELKYSILQRGVRTNQKLYDTLLSKIEESNLIKDVDLSNIRIVEKAVLPLTPFKPNKKLNFVLSIIFGLMTGLCLAFLRQYLDRSIHTEDDVQKHLDLPVLSVIPEADKRKGKSTETNTAKNFPIFLGDYPSNSRYAESFRTLRTNVNFSFLDNTFRAILLTSAAQGEGKTITALNLAHTLAQAGKSVLMIDADLRKPSLSNVVPENNSPGLTGIILDLFGTNVDKTQPNKSVGISDLIRLVSLQKKNGTLHLKDNKDLVEIRFVRGLIKDINWLTRPNNRKLAVVLGRSGLITTEQATQAIRRQRDTGQKLAFIIINMGILAEDDLKGPLMIHMIEALRTALQMRKGVFHFKESQEVESDQASFDPVDFDQVYKRALIGKESLPFLGKAIDEAIVRTDTKNLFLLPAGRLAPNPSEVMGSNRMAFLISQLKDRFDCLIIDTPPILPMSDALVLAPRTDGVLLVVRAGHIKREMLRNSVDQLKMAQANILGIVLNRVDLKKEAYYKYFHKYYSSYYTAGS